MQIIQQKACVIKNVHLLSKIHVNACVQVSSIKNEVVFSPSSVFISTMLTVHTSQMLRTLHCGTAGTLVMFSKEQIHNPNFSSLESCNFFSSLEFSSLKS